MTDIIPSDPANGPWRVLILDRAQGDPKWVLATVTLGSDVRPAAAVGALRELDDVRAWVASRLGHPVTLQPVGRALAWHVARGGDR